MAREAITTYRYLRIGMIGLVVMLGVSILLERAEVDCWQTSVSAYYYTPVRALLVGGLLAVGFALVVIAGRGPLEDTFLNAAGMFAPLVAVVPTTDVGACWSVPPFPPPTTPDGSPAKWVVANIDNNVAALLIAGLLGLVVAAVIASITNRDPLAVVRVGTPLMRLGLLAALVFLLVVGAAFLFWDDFDTRAHGISAVAMFVMLAGVVALNVRTHARHGGRTWCLVAYTLILVGMVGTAVVVWIVGGTHAVLVLETVEILLFALFWAVQTVEYWNEPAPAARAT